jgi:sugar phosphate isomerase/epimerase
VRYTRREWNTTVVGGLVAVPFVRLGAQSTSSRIAGVRVGTQTYSFRDYRDRNLDDMIAAMREIGLTYCELWSGSVEPRSSRATRREVIRKWRLDPATVDYLKDVRRRFDEAGITLTSYDAEVTNNFTDEEIGNVFAEAKALGVGVVTSSARVSVAPRLEQFAAKANMRVGFHNHSDFAKDGFTRAEDFFTALEAGPHMAITFDIGHFTAAGFDALAFLDAHHDRIVSLHIKDSKHKKPDSWVPFGEGDARVADVLKRLRDRKWDIPAHIEYEYRGQDTLDELKRLLSFCRRALEEK